MTTQSLSGTRPPPAGVGDLTAPAREPAPRRRADPPSLGGSLVVRVGIILAVLQALLRLLWGLGSYFTQDDFVFYSLAATQPFDLDYLIQDRGNHLMPAVQALVWILNDWAPLNHTAAVLAVTFIQLLANLAVLAMLIEAFGKRTAVLAPYSVYLWSALTLPAFLWWAASLNAVPLQLGLALAMLCHLRWLRTRRWGWILGTLGSVLLALVFFQKAVLALPLLFGLTWVLERRGTPLRDLFGVLRRHLAVWIPLSALVVSWMALYLNRVDSSFNAVRPTAGVGADLTVDSLAYAVAPSLVGGPWYWSSSADFLGYAPAPPPLLALFSWAALIAFTVAGLLLRRGFGRMLLVVTGYLAADIALILWGRAGAFGSGVGLELRYFADASLILAFALGFALMPARVEQEPWTRHAQPARAWLTSHPWQVRLASAVVLLVWTVSAVWSSLGLATAWRTQPARAYIENAKQSLAEADPETVLLNEPVPISVVLGWFAPYNGTQYVFAPLTDKPTFGTQTEKLLTINGDGLIREAQVSGVRSETGPLAGCGWAVNSTTQRVTRIPMEKGVFPWGWTVKIAYLAGKDTALTFALDDSEEVTVQLRKGLHDLYFPYVGEGRTVTIGGVDRGAAVCVDRIDIGNRIVDPGDEPLSPNG